MKKRFLMLGGLFAFAACLAAVTSVRAASVAPVFVNGNPTCESLGYAHGFKPAENTANESNPVGTYNFGGGSVTIAIDQNGVDWTSTVGVDAVIVKGGPNANLYAYDPPTESFGDTDLVPPTNASNGKPYGLSHLVFCYDYNVQVSKTADTTFSRSWDWNIEKTGDQTALTLANGESFDVNYQVTVDNDGAHDSDWAVAGSVTVHNPDPSMTATITGVTDNLSGFGAVSLDCGVTFPYSLTAGSDLVCSYSTGLPDATSRTNTATATTTGVVGGGSGQAAVTFGAPSSETDECINVTDDKAGFLGLVCAADAPKTFSYTTAVGPYGTCGAHQFVNTAEFITNDTQATGSSSWTVDVTVPCVLGCTLTQGYWKTHNDSFPGGAPTDDTWNLLAGGMAENKVFFNSGKTWYQVFWTAPQGNPYYILAHQYMAAKLNVLNGAATTPAVTAALASAETFFNTYTPSSTLSKTVKANALSWAATLGQYNTGLIGPGHCSEQQVL